MSNANPFKPTMGMNPPLLIDRENVVDDFIDAIDEGTGAPGRIMRITGPRGSGKTVLLTRLGDIARECGWVVVDEMATPPEGLVERICRKLVVPSRLSGVSLSVLGVGAEFDLGPENASTMLELAISHKLENLRDGKGVLITLDEIQAARRVDVEAIAAAVQLSVRAEKDVAFVFAGLTKGVASLLDEDSMTFLRRAKLEVLGPLDLGEVGRALRDTFAKSDMPISDDIAEMCVKASRGFPYMVQLVGYYVWREGRRAGRIGFEEARRGIDLAEADFAEAVLRPALRGVSGKEMEFLKAMARQDGPSEISSLREFLGWDSGYANTYRARLMSDQVIDSPRRGYVDFAIPYLREYLRKERKLHL